MVDLLAGVFGGLARVSAVAVITAANPVQAVLFLVLVFCQAAGLRLLLEAEFRALLLRVVYVGAIAVLFLFVVRRLNVPATPRRRGEWRRTLPRVSAVAALLLAQLAVVYGSWVPAGGLASVAVHGRAPAQGAALQWVESLDGRTNLEARGQLLYSHYFLYFLRAGFVLLVARVGAIVLTVQRSPVERVRARRQRLHEQLSRDRERAVVRLRRRGESRGPWQGSRGAGATGSG